MSPVGVGPMRSLRVGRALRRSGSTHGGRWELPLLAAIATFILALGAAPFVAPADGWRFSQVAGFDWVGPADSSNEQVRSVPMVGVARVRANGDYSYTPELRYLTVHLVRPTVWSAYQRDFLGANLEGTVSADDLVLDRQTAYDLGVDVGDKIAVVPFFTAAEVAPVEVRVGAVISSYVDPESGKTGLLAVTGRRLGAPTVEALGPQGRAWRFGIGPTPAGATGRDTIADGFLAALVSAGAGPANTVTLLLGGVLWLLALARYARRLVTRDLRAVALLVTLGCRARVTATAAALPVLMLGLSGTALGGLLTSRLIYQLIRERYISTLALVPLSAVMVATSSLVAVRTYRGLLVRARSARLYTTLTEES